MTKVVSFSVWGDTASFWSGAVANALAVRDVYPGWESWFHVPHDAPNWRIAALRACNREATPVRIILMPPGPDWSGLFWRFTPIFDPAVERTLIRDTDSLVNAREAVAV